MTWSAWQRGRWKRSEGLPLHCHLYVLICVVWCCEILHLILKFQGPLLELGDLKVMVKLFAFWRSFLGVLVVSWGLYHFITIFTFYSIALVKVPVNFCSSMWISRISVSSISGNPFLELYLLTQGSLLFYPDNLENSWKSLSASSQHFFQ